MGCRCGRCEAAAKADADRVWRCLRDWRRVRHGQLTRLDSYQLGRSLVGCSLPHTAHRNRPAGPPVGPRCQCGSALPKNLAQGQSGSVDPNVVAAWIAAAAAGLSAAVNAYLFVWRGRRQRETELLVNALTHFVGGSQQRSAGIAALRVLSGPPKRQARRLPACVSRVLRRVHSNRSTRAGVGWRRYGPAVGELFTNQVVYVLSEGKNRWKAHEIANVIAMVDWLLADRELDLDAAKRRSLAAAMGDYLHESAKGPLNADWESLEYIRHKIEEWDDPQLIPGASTAPPTPKKASPTPDQ